MNTRSDTFLLSVCRPTSPKRRVTDMATRMFHWLFAFSFLGAYVTSEGERWRNVHITLGYTMIGLLAARILWGIWGPKRSRLSTIAQRIKSIRPWLSDLKSGKSLSGVNWTTPQNALTGLFVASLLGLTVPLVLSGYMTEADLLGSFMEEVHEFFGESYLMVVLAHIGTIAFFSVIRRKNLAHPMVSGYTAGAGPDLVKTNHVIWALALLSGTLAWWIWSLAI